MKNNIDQLKEMIERLHQCKAHLIGNTLVKETHKDKVVWEGVVHTFKITGNPQAELCYAWASPMEGSTKLRFYAVLHVPPIDSPEKAVKASIVQDFKTGYKD